MHKLFTVGDFDFQVLRVRDGVIEVQAIVDVGEYETVLVFTHAHHIQNYKDRLWHVRDESGKIGNLDNLDRSRDGLANWKFYEKPIQTIFDTATTDLAQAIQAIGDRYIRKHLPIVVSEGGTID